MKDRDNKHKTLEDSMRDIFLFYLTFSISVRAVVCYDSTGKPSYHKNEKSSKCWRSFRAQELLTFMDRIDREYASARKEAQEYLDKTNFTTRVLEKILIEGLIDNRDSPDQLRYHAKIPSGTHLGGLCIMNLPNSVLFFHRMKLLNDTFFQVRDLHIDIENMVLKGQLLSKGLHLTGAYDSSLKDKNPLILKHTNSYGELQISMENVQYTIEGYYILNNDRPVIEVIVSILDAENNTLTHANATKTDAPIWLDKQNMGDFMMRLKSDLDMWVQDYFNNYLDTSLEDVLSISKLREYNQHKYIHLAKFMDDALIRMNLKLRSTGGDVVRIPNFKITASNNISIQIQIGTIRGLDTMYRRSQATSVLKKNNNRYVNTIIGFRDLKITYAYAIKFTPGRKMRTSITGLLIMSAKQQTAHLTVELLNHTQVLKLDIDFLNRMGPDAITIEGATNILKTNLKHIIHNEITTIMSNSLIHFTDFFKTLPNCDPSFGMHGIKKNITLKIVKLYTRRKRRWAPIEKVIEELKSTPKMIPRFNLIKHF